MSPCLRPSTTLGTNEMSYGSFAFGKPPQASS